MLIALGKINGVFGIKGWVKIYSYTRPRERIFEYSPWILDRDDSRSELTVSDAQVHGKGLIARLEGIEDRNQAEKKNTISAGGMDKARKFRTQRAARRAPGAPALTLRTSLSRR